MTPSYEARLNRFIEEQLAPLRVALRELKVLPVTTPVSWSAELEQVGHLAEELMAPELFVVRSLRALHVADWHAASFESLQTLTMNPLHALHQEARAFAAALPVPPFVSEGQRDLLCAGPVDAALRTVIQARVVSQQHFPEAKWLGKEECDGEVVHQKVVWS